MYHWPSLVLGSRALQSMAHMLTFTSKFNQQVQATLKSSKPNKSKHEIK